MRFLAAVLGSDKGRAALSKLAKGSSGSMKNITKPDVLAFLVIAPSLAEQQRIATCLSSLDDLIAAQSANLEALKSHKKGLIQQFFPSEGETVPHLRFPEFQDAPEWEETTLGEIVHFESGGTPSKQNPGFWDGSIPWVSAKDMKQFFLNDPEDHITSVAVDDGAKQVPAGTVLMLTRGMTLFKDVPICVVRRSMSFNQDVKALRAQGGLNQQFLPHLLVANRQRLLGMVDAAGHGTGRLNTDELKSLIVTYPHESEQMRIASCLANLEFLIPTHKDKLEALKTHKQGLCHQLFPS
jgi:type I restriction enzyme S subunit